jgi:hypothetical protein
MVITCAKSIAEVVANLIENFDFVFGLHDRMSRINLPRWCFVHSPVLAGYR